MAFYHFGAWISFGKGDSGETAFDIDLSEEEVERMETLRNMPANDRPEFQDCEWLSDIYKKAYEAAVTQITVEQLDYSEYEPDWDEAKEGRPWRADDDFPVTVTIPWQYDEIEE